MIDIDRNTLIVIILWKVRLVLREKDFVPVVEIFYGAKQQELPDVPQQLELF